MTVNAYVNTGAATLIKGSSIVTGHGTTWLTDNLHKDDRVESDVGQSATILSIDSDTQVTLDKVYMGTAQDAGAYKIWRTPPLMFVMGAAREIQRKDVKRP